LEVADIFRAAGPAFRQSHALSSEQLQVMAAIETCRTAALGGHVKLCPDCAKHREISYNSCRNRHCPKCQALAQARWIAQREQRILPTHYFHVVFTLSAALRPLAWRNRQQVFHLLFKTATETLLELGEDPKRLGATLGITAVLHTWTRQLHFHPHLHCIVTGGGLNGQGQWVSTQPDFLFPVRVLSALFRGKFLANLRALHRQGQLELGQPTGRAHKPIELASLVHSLYRTKWVVYAKPPFGGPRQVFAYLGRYTHRVAISNARLIAYVNGQVTFATKNGGSVTISDQEFIRRFLCHVLPKKFVKIRHYGLLSPCHAKTTLERARQALPPLTTQADSASPDLQSLSEGIDQPADNQDFSQPWTTLLAQLTGQDVTRCRHCGAVLRRLPLDHPDSRPPPATRDTS